MLAWGKADMLRKKTNAPDWTVLDLKAPFAEFWGVLFLVVFAVGAVVVTGYDDALTAAFAFGASYLALSYALMQHSEAQLNPAVTISLVFCGRITVYQTVLNLIAQFSGAIVGSLLLWGMYLYFAQSKVIFVVTLHSCCRSKLIQYLAIHPCSEDLTNNLGSNVISDSFGATYAFLGEFVGTFFVVFGEFSLFCIFILTSVKSSFLYRIKTFRSVRSLLGVCCFAIWSSYARECMHCYWICLFCCALAVGRNRWWWSQPCPIARSRCNCESTRV